MSASKPRGEETVFGTRAFERLQEVSADEARAGMVIMMEMASRSALGSMHRLVVLPDDLPRQAVAVFAPAPDGGAPLLLVSERNASDAVLALSASIASQHDSRHSAQSQRTLLLLPSGELLDETGALVDRIDMPLLSEERSRQHPGEQLEHYPGRSIEVPGFGRGRVIGLD